MKTFDLKSLLLGVALTMTIVVVMLLATSNSAPAAWDYKLVGGTYMGINSENLINSAATQGWEVVGVAIDKEDRPWAMMRRPKAVQHRAWWRFWK